MTNDAVSYNLQNHPQPNSILRNQIPLFAFFNPPPPFPPSPPSTPLTSPSWDMTSYFQSLRCGSKFVNGSVTGLLLTTSNMPLKIASIKLVSSHPEVYDPCDDSFLLVDALLADRSNLVEHRPSICMEIGCGSGYVITSLSLLLGNEYSGAYYIATDINPHAARVTRETLESHGCHAEVVNTDIALGLEKRLARSVDVIVVNPPYVPTPEEEVGCDGIASAWAGGVNGRRVIDRILPVADEILSDKGWLYLLTLAENNPLELCLDMRKKGYASRIVLQRSTDEESLHVIKFWRDSDILSEAYECATVNKVEDGVVAESATFSPFSIWRRGNRSV